MPNVEEFYHLKKDGVPRGALAAQVPVLRERNHNFRHFSSFIVESTFYRFKTVLSGVKCIFEIAFNNNAADPVHLW